MNIPENLILEYIDGRLLRAYEIVPGGVPHGISVLWSANGSIREECYYQNGSKHGLYRDWYPSGHLWEENNFIDGVLQGTRKLWYSSGQLLIDSFYIDNKVHGIYLRYYEDGTLDEIEFFDHGTNITDQIKELVKNIKRITKEEKTLIAMQFGLMI